jgi:phosphoribosylformylglycinamidine synthase
VTVHPEQREQFETIMTGHCFASIGVVTEEAALSITGLNGTPIITADLFELKEAWQQTLREL